VQVTKKEEQELLERIRQEFGAKHVVRVCSMYECDKVLEGARRLLEFAPAIKQSVDLRGASLAIDDCYEVWGSGFISIPYDFTLQELQPQLMKLLGNGSSNGNASNGSSSGLGGGARSSSSPQPQQPMRPMAAARGTGPVGLSSQGLCSRHALQGRPHLGWALAGLPWVSSTPQQQRRQQQQQYQQQPLARMCSNGSSGAAGPASRCRSVRAAAAASSSAGSLRSAAGRLRLL
jgi:hypothetical protein